MWLLVCVPLARDGPLEATDPMPFLSPSPSAARSERCAVSGCEQVEEGRERDAARSPLLHQTCDRLLAS